MAWKFCFSFWDVLFPMRAHTHTYIHASGVLLKGFSATMRRSILCNSAHLSLKNNICTITTNPLGATIASFFVVLTRSRWFHAACCSEAWRRHQRQRKSSAKKCRYIHLLLAQLGQPNHSTKKREILQFQYHRLSVPTFTPKTPSIWSEKPLPRQCA